MEVQTLDPKIERLFSSYWTRDMPNPIYNSGNTYENITWIDSYGTPHTRRAEVEHCSRYKIAFFDTEEPQDECYCESLL